MKRFLTLFVALTLLLMFSGCKTAKSDTGNAHSEISIILPTDDTVNGYRQENSSVISTDDSSPIDEQTDGYYVNTKTKKFHLLSCVYAQKGSKNGIWSELERDELINGGYSPCSKCNP